MNENLKNIVWRVLRIARNICTPIFRFQEISVLVYHSVSDANSPTAVPLRDFEQQLSALRKSGAVFVPLGSVAHFAAGKGVLPRRAISLTFDDGYADFETAVLPVLERLQIPATLFMVGDTLASRTALHNDIPLLSAEALGRVAKHPLVALGFHSMTHANLVRTRADALSSECHSPYPTEFFAYPGGNYSDEAIAELKRQGYRGAFSIKPTLVHKGADLFLLPRSVILRDMPLWRVVSQTTKAAEWYRGLRK